MKCVKEWAEEIYNITKQSTAYDCIIPYNKINSFNPMNKDYQSDVIGYLWDFRPSFSNLHSAVFDDENQHIVVRLHEILNKEKVNKYTLDDYREFCDNALQAPPVEEFEDGSIDEDEWYKQHNIHIISGNHDIELDYNADNVNEIEYALREMYEAEYDGPPTTGNTVGSEYRNATWKDILRFHILDQCYNASNTMQDWIRNCIDNFMTATLQRILKEMTEQTSMSDELKVNFLKLDTTDLWKIFNKEERRQAFKEILCSKIEISELISEKGKHDDIVVIMDYSIKPSGDLVGWHYGADFDKNSEDNQYYIQKYIEEMTE